MYSVLKDTMNIFLCKSRAYFEFGDVLIQQTMTNYLNGLMFLYSKLYLKYRKIAREPISMTGCNVLCFISFQFSDT